MQQLADYLALTSKKPAALAKELGVEPSTITRILKGERKPSLQLAMRINAATGVPIDDLLPELRGAMAAPEKDAAA